MTPEGKEKLQKGSFKPKYFTLGDYDLIYSQDRDSNISENSTKVHNRLKDSIRLSTQVDFGEKRVNSNLSSLGTSVSKSQEAPYFEIKTKKAEMSSVSYEQSNQLFDSYNIPQVNLRDILSFLRTEKDDSGVSLDIFEGNELRQADFEDTTLDGFRFFIESDGFTIDISEENGSKEFSFELFEVTKDSENHEVLKEVTFEEEEGYYFSDMFNIQVDGEEVVKTQTEIVKPSDLFNLKDIEEC